LPMLLGPSPGVTAHSVVAALRNRAREVPRRSGSASATHGPTWPHCLTTDRRAPPSIVRARAWLDVPLVFERRLTRPQNLADRVAGHLVSTVSIPLTARSNQSEQRIRPTFRGSILDADPPTQGVKIARRMTIGSEVSGKPPSCRRSLQACRRLRAIRLCFCEA
jgi:hypothetical protein